MWSPLTPTRAWQLYQLLRALGALGVSICFAWGVSDVRLLAEFEGVLALSTLASGPLLTALGQAYLRTLGTATPADQRGVQLRFQQVGTFLLLGAAGVLGLMAALSESPTVPLLAMGLLLSLAPSPLLELSALTQRQLGLLVTLGLVQALGLPLLAVAVALGASEAALVYFGLVMGVRVLLRPPLQRMTTGVWGVESTRAQFPWPLWGLLMLSAVAAAGADALDAVLVRGLLSESAFLTFRYGARELPLTLVLATAVSGAMAHRLAQSAWANDRTAALAELRREHTRLLPICFGATGAVLLLSDALVGVVYPPAYAEAARLIDVYALLVIVRVLLPQAVLLGLGHTRALVTASMTELILHVGLTLALQPLLGLYAPALAALTAYAYEKVYLLLALRRAGVRIGEVVDVPRWGAYSLGLLMLYAAKEFWL